ncbi:hypothetical protein Tco_0840624 [Tanacetum coccineum]|uniref:Transposase n=1 Tax=Tanacetum coccineum TaxID=301880 RepID=A0ABQ5AX25_9ASTR
MMKDSRTYHFNWKFIQDYCQDLGITVVVVVFGRTQYPMFNQRESTYLDAKRVVDAGYLEKDGATGLDIRFWRTKMEGASTLSNLTSRLAPRAGVKSFKYSAREGFWRVLLFAIRRIDEMVFRRLCGVFYKSLRLDSP